MITGQPNPASSPFNANFVPDVAPNADFLDSNPMITEVPNPAAFNPNFESGWVEVDPSTLIAGPSVGFPSPNISFPPPPLQNVQYSGVPQQEGTAGGGPGHSLPHPQGGMMFVSSSETPQTVSMLFLIIIFLIIIDRFELSSHYKTTESSC